MVNLGLLGDISAGKKSILRMFANYINSGKIDEYLDDLKLTLVTQNISKDLNLSRIVIREDKTNRAHTIYAPGGDKDHPVVRMGMITITRIATQIIAVFSVVKDLKKQLELFNEVQFFHDKIFVCINKIDLLTGDRNKKIEELREKITEFFNGRRISIIKFHLTCGESVEGFEKYNHNAVIMILMALKLIKPPPIIFKSDLKKGRKIRETEISPSPVTKDKHKTPIKRPEVTYDEFIPSQVLKNIKVTRGGDWKVEHNQSIFTYKVKVLNASNYVITNVQIFITSVPSGLITKNDRYKIHILNPNTYESPSFKFIAKDSCVGDYINSVVIYNDHFGTQQTIAVPPLKIEYVCNLLVPKTVTEEVFQKNTEFMKENKLAFDCKLTPDELKSELLDILEHNNFFILNSDPDSEITDVKKIKAYAEGKYDKQDVALSILMQKTEDKTNKLLIKAMSVREEKIIDLLKDISIKCDPLKSESEKLTQIEIICENCEKVIRISDYMRLKEIIICEACGEEIKMKSFD